METRPRWQQQFDVSLVLHGLPRPTVIVPRPRRKTKESTKVWCLRRNSAKICLCSLAILIFIYIHIDKYFIYKYRRKVNQLLKRKRRCQHVARYMDDGAFAAALTCLRRTQPNLDLEYPRDVEEHFYEIRQALAPWAQHTAHKMHQAAGYGGPWIENHWISHFEQNIYDQSDLCLSDHFGPYIPLFIPWVDIWVAGKRNYPPGFVDTLYSVLRPNVPYITVSQNDQGLTGRNEIPMSTIPNVLVLSAGGYGHVPIPLFKQHEPLNNRKHPNERQYAMTYTGSMEHAPKRIREKMHVRFTNDTRIHYKHYFGPEWRTVMAESRFSLTPRGYGRSAYHLMEILQMGHIPIHIYSDIPWVPYADVYREIGFSNHYVKGIDELVSRLENTTAEQIVELERRIVELRDSHFSVQGVLDQIQRFMLNEENDLRCQKLPATVRDV